MAASAPTAQPDGGAGTPPLRRPGALRGIIRNGSVFRWLGLGPGVDRGSAGDCRTAAASVLTTNTTAATAGGLKQAIIGTFMLTVGVSRRPVLTGVLRATLADPQFTRGRATARMAARSRPEAQP
jgi:hypothetical protein